MKPSELLARHRAAVLDLIGRYHFVNPRVFGPDDPDAALNLSVEGSASSSLEGYGELATELENLLGRTVHVVVANHFTEFLSDEQRTALAAARPF